MALTTLPVGNRRREALLEVPGTKDNDALRWQRFDGPTSRPTG